MPPFLSGTRTFDITSDSFGAEHFQASLHELLDDPQKTGKRYALKDDACFLPDLYQAVTQGAYGPGSQFNMSRRFAFGISSGGYNTSRMAVSFNQGTADGIVGIGTMRPYFDKLARQGVPVDKVEHRGGHEFTADVLGATGIKAWFDRF